VNWEHLELLDGLLRCVAPDNSRARETPQRHLTEAPPKSLWTGFLRKDHFRLRAIFVSIGAMRFLFAFVVGFASVNVVFAGWKVQSAVTLGQVAPGVEAIETRCVSDEAQVRVTAVVFESGPVTLRVLESTSPGSATLENSLRHAGAVAGVNGGYFHKDFTPVGLVMADGKIIHPLERAKLLSGIAGARADGSVAILRTSAYDPKKSGFLQAIQCGPMLIEGGKTVPGLESTRLARRTVVATGPGGNVALIHMTSVSLADAAEILAVPGILDTWRPLQALNLDGGTSTGLWAGDRANLPEIKKVANFLAVAATPEKPCHQRRLKASSGQ
jgi:uncharacterized protein YigE (DUF2233 family)